jgi:hypothetical protein
MGLPDLLPRRGWAIVVGAAVVAGVALFVGPSVTGLSPLTHVLVVGSVEAACAVTVLGAFFRYTGAEDSDTGDPGDEEWRYES